MSSTLIISTRAVQGITTDPFCAYRWASFSDDGLVRLFDLRKIGEPILSFGTDYKNGIKQIEWSRFQSGILGVLGRDSSVVKIYEIQEIYNTCDNLGEENDAIEGTTCIVSSVRKGIFFYFKNISYC